MHHPFCTSNICKFIVINELCLETFSRPRCGANSDKNNIGSLY